MNHTTQTFARTARQSGTEYANAFEHYRTRRRDWSGIWIVIGCAALMAAPYIVIAWSKS